MQNIFCQHFNFRRMSVKLAPAHYVIADDYETGIENLLGTFQILPGPLYFVNPQANMLMPSLQVHYHIGRFNHVHFFSRICQTLLGNFRILLGLLLFFRNNIILVPGPAHCQIFNNIMPIKQPKDSKLSPNSYQQMTNC